MTTQPEIAWQPHPGPQTDFLLDTSDECLYGGAAGGGKSDAMIIDAAGLNQRRPDGSIQHAIDHPKYRAIIFRKSSTDLTEVIDRCLELYPAIDPKVKYLKTKRWFVFDSGARVELGSLPDPGDELNYKSRQFQYIGWEELTEHATSDAYEYLMSRNRGPAELPKYIRATTNPDGPGHSWVKKWFQISKEGGAVPRFEDKVEIDGEVKVFTRRFIPAKITDNLSLDVADPNYKFRLARMSPEKRRALLEGRWDIVNIAGVIFQKQLEKMLLEERICKVPYLEGYPVHTFWDFGASDSTAVWCMQRIKGINRFINYFEDNHEGLSHYWKWLQDTGYIWGQHCFPHDADHDKQGKDSVESLASMAWELGMRDIQIVPRCPTIAVGLEAARQGFGGTIIDEDNCEAGIDCLKNYRYKEDGSSENAPRAPLHNKFSNGADAFRQFGQYLKAEGIPEDKVEPPTTGVYMRKKRSAPEKQNWVP